MRFSNPIYRRLIAASSLVVVASILLPPSLHAAQSVQTRSELASQQYAEFTPPADSNQPDSQASITGGTHFRPPKDASPLTGPNIGNGGSRNGSCLGSTQTAFAAFGPNTPGEVLGRTVSPHPTFVWYLPDSETTAPVIFRLLAPNENDVPIAFFTETLDYTPGFVTYQLPDTMPPLSPGISYRWQVIIECNPLRPSQALIQKLAFEVVPKTAALSQALAKATTDAERASAYGQAGIWYDAIATVAQATAVSDQQLRGQLLTDLLSAISPDLRRLRQDILRIVEATTPTPVDESSSLR